MTRERHLAVRITDWPAFHRTTEISLSPRLFPDERQLREHLHRRFGPGRLVSLGQDAWEYRRDVRGLAALGKVFSRILKHGYA